MYLNKSKIITNGASRPNMSRGSCYQLMTIIMEIKHTKATSKYTPLVNVHHHQQPLHLTDSHCCLNTSYGIYPGDKVQPPPSPAYRCAIKLMPQCVVLRQTLGATWRLLRNEFLNLYAKVTKNYKLIIMQFCDEAAGRRSIWATHERFTERPKLKSRPGDRLS
jgi:hypothetical protein